MAVKAKTKYKWWRWPGHHRFDLILMGEPDAFAYIVRYDGPVKGIYGSRWCWSLTMPRGGRETARGWDTAAYRAKRQVEAYIEEHWG
jgi:hypothetical protein